MARVPGQLNTAPSWPLKVILLLTPKLTVSSIFYQIKLMNQK